MVNVTSIQVCNWDFAFSDCADRGTALYHWMSFKEFCIKWSYDFWGTDIIKNISILISLLSFLHFPDALYHHVVQTWISTRPRAHLNTLFNFDLFSSSALSNCSRFLAGNTVMRFALSGDHIQIEFPGRIYNQVHQSVVCTKSGVSELGTMGAVENTFNILPDCIYAQWWWSPTVSYRSQPGNNISSFKTYFNICLLLARLILQPRKWKQYVCLECQYTTRLHGIIFQKTAFFMVTAMRTWKSHLHLLAFRI
jgi:hypothetical protein